MKILIVDDHPVLRSGLAALLEQAWVGTVILQAGAAPEAMALLDDVDDLDIVILDLVLPGMGGLAALAEIGRRRPGLPVIVLSSAEEPHEARRALAQGALGYVPKSASQRTIAAAIDLVMAGEIYVPPLLLNESVSRQGRVSASALLTERHIEVLRCLGAGLSNMTIALKLGLSEKTVKAHVTAILKSLNAENRTQAAALAHQTGLI